MEKQKIHNVRDKKSKKTLLKYKKELTTALRKRFMTPGKSVFRHYYDSSLKVIEDFKRYKEDTSSNPVQTSKQQQKMFLQW